MRGETTPGIRRILRNSRVSPGRKMKRQLQRLLHSPAVHRLAHFHLESYAVGSITAILALEGTSIPVLVTGDLAWDESPTRDLSICIRAHRPRLSRGSCGGVARIGTERKIEPRDCTPSTVRD